MHLQFVANKCHCIYFIFLVFFGGFCLIITDPPTTHSNFLVIHHSANHAFEVELSYAENQLLLVFSPHPLVVVAHIFTSPKWCDTCHGTSRSSCNFGRTLSSVQQMHKLQTVVIISIWFNSQLFSLQQL